VVEGFDTDEGGGNNEGGSGSSGPLGVCDEEGGVGSGDDETDDENTADIEDQDTPEGPPDRDRDVLPGILGLADGDTDEFGSHVGEESVDKSGPETKEGGQTCPAGKLCVEVLTHGAMGGIPVTETTAGEKDESRGGGGQGSGNAHIRSCLGLPPRSMMIPRNILRCRVSAMGAESGVPMKIKPIKARTLILENQNSSSPNTRTPRRLTKKTGGGSEMGMGIPR